VPRIPGVRYLDAEEEQLTELARWLTGSEQKYFARATVNRLWHAMFGRGLVEPIDDLRDTNPSTHPQLLERLADDFVASGANLCHTLRTIALSHAYGRGDAGDPPSAAEERYYSSSQRRPLMPEVLADAIADVTGVPDEFEKWPSGTRAVKLIDPLTPAPALDGLGRCAPSATCTGLTANSIGVATQLHLINGELINRKLIEPQGRLQRLISQNCSNSEIVREFFLRGLSREPSEKERVEWCRRLDEGPESERHARLEDFVWSLLNSRQFMENQ
jgi:hypothetical protein